MFQVPLSAGELALDEFAYQEWLADPEPKPFEPIPVNAELEKRLAAQRNVWYRRAHTVAEVASAELQVRMAQQRTAREAHALLLESLKTETERARELSRKLYGPRGRIRLACNTSYLTAMSLHLPTYQSFTECSKCGGTTRRTIGGACYDCDMRRFNPQIRQWRYNRFMARAAGEKKFEGAPCVKCSGTLRYVAQSNCVACDTRRPGRYKRKGCAS